MIYATKGAFIQALKDTTYLKDKISEQEQMLERFEYLRYGKIKSPLDYDVIGYKNNETIRELKVVRTVQSGENIYERNSALEGQIKKCKDKINAYKKIIDDANDDLSAISEPLKSILRVRYIEHKKLRYVCKRFKELYLDDSGMYKYIMRELDKYYE